MTGDLPQFIDTGHSHTVYGLNNLAQGRVVTGTANASDAWTGAQGLAQAAIGGGYVSNQTTAVPDTWHLPRQQGVKDATCAIQRVAADYREQVKQEKETKVGRRLVQVFIADPNENVPLEHSLLYSGDQKLTDATDQELFYDIDIKERLEDHNKKRVKWIDKKVKERVEHLEPARIRDLKMIVVTVATF